MRFVALGFSHPQLGQPVLQGGIGQHCFDGFDRFPTVCRQFAKAGSIEAGCSGSDIVHQEQTAIVRLFVCLLNRVLMRGDVLVEIIFARRGVVLPGLAFDAVLGHQLANRRVLVDPQSGLEHLLLGVVDAPKRRSDLFDVGEGRGAICLPKALGTALELVLG